jgi:hypothetical protein
MSLLRGAPPRPPRLAALAAALAALLRAHAAPVNVTALDRSTVVVLDNVTGALLAPLARQS